MISPTGVRAWVRIGLLAVSDAGFAGEGPPVVSGTEHPHEMMRPATTQLATPAMGKTLPPQELRCTGMWAYRIASESHQDLVARDPHVVETSETLGDRSPELAGQGSSFVHVDTPAPVGWDGRPGGR